MIHTQTAAGGRVSIIMNDRYAVAFVDRDWVHAGSGAPTPALALDANGCLWWGKEQVPLAEREPAIRAAELLSLFAEDVVRVVQDVNPSMVHVTGVGLVAEEVRRRLGPSNDTPKQRPHAVIEMTGDHSELETATSLVADGGLVVLAGEAGRPLEINLYTDVHRRGLRMVGVPGAGYRRELDSSELRELPEPVSVQAGDELPSGLWYRVTAGPKLPGT